MIFPDTMTFWLAGILATFSSARRRGSVQLCDDREQLSFRSIVSQRSFRVGIEGTADLESVFGRMPVRPALPDPRLLRYWQRSCLYFSRSIADADHGTWQQIARPLAVFAIGWIAGGRPMARPQWGDVGHWGLTEEYGSATLIERFACEVRTPRSCFAFPYCLPKNQSAAELNRRSGPAAWSASLHASQLFSCRTTRSARGGRRRSCRLDPLIGGIAQEEISRNWWRHLVVGIPLGWCGVWVGGWVGLGLVTSGW